jgi:hypothetical protein
LNGGATSAYGKTNTPLSFKLFQNYPNSFNPSIKIEYYVAEPSFVLLKIYNIVGTEITTLVS